VHLQIAAVLVRSRSDERRIAKGPQHLENDAQRSRTDAGDSRQRTAVLFGQLGQRLFERHHGSGGALVAEHLRLRRLCVRQIAQGSADDSVHVPACSGQRLMYAGGA
jgi:hypothetical protein